MRDSAWEESKQIWSISHSLTNTVRRLEDHDKGLQAQIASAPTYLSTNILLSWEVFAKVCNVEHGLAKSCQYPRASGSCKEERG